VKRWRAELDLLYCEHARKSREIFCCVGCRPDGNLDLSMSEGLGRW
jgi:hypothetical protein